MTLLWVAVGGYLLISWALSIWALNACVEAGEWEDMAQRSGQSVIRFNIVCYCLVPFIGPFIPLIGFLCFYESWRYRRRLIALDKHYHPLQHRRMRRDDLPVEVLQSFFEPERTFEELGFVVDGYFFQKDKPLTIHACNLTDPSGTITVTICNCDGDVGLELVSVTQDGKITTTAAIECMAAEEGILKINEKAGMRIAIRDILADDFSIEDLVEVHRESMANERGAWISISNSQTDEVLEYHYVTFQRARYELGEIKDCPELVDLPRTRIAS